MASIDHSAPTNGHYGGQSYSDQSFTAAPADFTSASQPTAQSNGSPQEIPKDEVGWYFVEQYYTTLSKNPEKLFLFYNKKSQFVSGTEAEKVMTCVGQKAINERIKELDIQDCKVRVTNVDSQGSGPNIIIQVIGEISSKSQPQKKFVQTFVLAEQTNGYFVLNDIFRYIHEEADEGQEDEQPVNHASTGAQAKLSAGSDGEDLVLADEKSPEAHANHDSQGHPINATQEISSDQPADEQTPDQASASPGVATTAIEDKAPTAAATDVATEVAAEDITQPERPSDPKPTPVASPPKQAAQSVKPAAPKTWAGLVAANRVALPAQAPNVQSASSGGAVSKAKTSTPTTSATVSTSAAPATPLSTASEVEAPTTPASSGPEWQTAQRDGHARKQSRAQPSPAAIENSRGYIKNVNSNVSEEDLKEKLDSVGKVVYFDINRQKNCAFVDFADAAAYQAAVAASPIEVNGERFFVEERRIKAASGAFGGPANNGRGGGFNRSRGDRPNSTPGRGGFPREGGRGGYNLRGRGGSASRGRGGAAPQ